LRAKGGVGTRRKKQTSFAEHHKSLILGKTSEPLDGVVTDLKGVSVTKNALKRDREERGVDQTSRKSRTVSEEPRG